MNLDVRNEMVASVKNAIENGNVEEFANHMMSFSEDMKNEILKDFEDFKATNDQKILESRGYKALTQNEMKFYDSLIGMAKGQSLSGFPAILPEETFERMFEDLVTSHPLLAHVDAINTKSVMAKIIVNTGISGVAGWGELCATIDDEITSGFAFREIPQNKLSAYMEVCKTLLDLGYVWVDRYVRLCLGEAIAIALEDGILNGTGSNMPIGLTKVVAAAGTTQTIPAAAKQAITLADLSAASLSTVAVTLSNNGTREVGKMIMVVNPVDYYGKIIPATRVMGADGRWNEYLPYPVEFVMSTKVAANSAVIFRDFGYQLVVGIGKDAAIERADQYKFYEDLVCYKAKVVAGGMPKDNNVAVVADITNLAPAYFTVKQV